MAGEVVLKVEEIEAGYGRAALVLRGLSLQVRAGEVVCLVGPNGAGKSTVLKVVTGLLAPRSGRVLLRDADISGMPPHRLLRMGVAHVLQGHSLFPDMTVGENIQLGGYAIDDSQLKRERIERVRSQFPIVAERWKSAAGLLSGGQQKMVEFARAMMLDPSVLLLDEPSMGLEPRSMASVFRQIGALRDAGTAVLLVEQNARSALAMADRGCVLDLGRIRLEGAASDLLADPRMASVYFGQAPKLTGASGSGPSVPDAQPAGKRVDGRSDQPGR